MFLGSFAWSFVFVSLPFHIERVSTLDAAATLRWTGWILGISSLVTVVTSPLWGMMAGRGDPKRFYVRTQALQALGFVGMAVARTLLELFLVRIVLGVAGASSTFAFIMIGREGDPGVVRRRVAAVQSAMTVGQVIGPLIGAIAAARIGFRPSFVLGAALLLTCAGLVQWLLPPGSEQGEAAVARRPAPPLREVIAVSLLILGGSTQIFFFTSILPQTLPPFGVAKADTLEVGGVLIFASGVGVALGSLIASRLAELAPERQLIPALLLASSLLLASMGLVSSVWLYGIARFLQVLCIAPLFPIVVARVAHASGHAVGVINSARIGAAFLGPVIATTVLSWTSPAGLYAVLAVIGLACLPLTVVREARPRGWP
jgi:DHA1 family multidrug resistance protein-like MFS transporter